jgi:rubredoxin
MSKSTHENKDKLIENRETVFEDPSINFFCKRCALSGRYPPTVCITGRRDPEAARAIAEAQGWRLTDKGWCCPDCLSKLN